MTDRPPSTPRPKSTPPPSRAPISKSLRAKPGSTLGSTPVSTPRVASTPRPPQPRQPSSMQIVFGSILAISLLLAINFSGRIAAGQRIQSELVILEATIRAEQIRATALKVESDFVDSDAFVEKWARSQEGKMVKPGEILIVPVPGRQAPTPTPTPLVAQSSTVGSSDVRNSSLWWQLFFDSPAPGETQ